VCPTGGGRLPAQPDPRGGLPQRCLPASHARPGAKRRKGWKMTLAGARRPVGGNATEAAGPTAEQVRHIDLPRVRWGRYHREVDVRRALNSAADRIQVLELEVQRLSRMLHQREVEIEQRRYGVGLPTNGQHAEL